MAALGWTVVLLAGLACSATGLGTSISLEDSPSIAQVESRVGTLWLQQCAASVLTSYHVLSTASCFSVATYSANTRRIRAGAAKRGTDGVVVGVSMVYEHPSFGQLLNPDGKPSKDGDLAVVVLDTALPLGPTIQQASILGEGIYLPDGLTLQLVGWGTTTEGGLVGNSDLYSLDLITINNDECLETYLSAENPETITENMICAGLRSTNGRNLDSRDEGSPLFFDGVTVGVVSFGVSRGDDKFPVVSTAIASYTSWIVATASER